MTDTWTRREFARIGRTLRELQETSPLRRRAALAGAAANLAILCVGLALSGFHEAYLMVPFAFGSGLLGSHAVRLWLLRNETETAQIASLIESEIRSSQGNAEDILRSYADSSEPLLRGAVARMQRCSAEILAKLSGDLEAFVRVAVVINAGCPFSVLETLVRDGDPIVSEAARRVIRQRRQRIVEQAKEEHRRLLRALLFVQHRLSFTQRVSDRIGRAETRFAAAVKLGDFRMIDQVSAEMSLVEDEIGLVAILDSHPDLADSEAYADFRFDLRIVNLAIRARDVGGRFFEEARSLEKPELAKNASEPLSVPHARDLHDSPGAKWQTTQREREVYDKLDSRSRSPAQREESSDGVNPAAPNNEHQRSSKTKDQTG